MNSLSTPQVMVCSDLPDDALASLLRPLGMDIQWIADGWPIPGSYWGENEAGLIRNQLFVRGDTPVHSALHEAGHFLCADPVRQAEMHTDAGGVDQEESAVCYLQVLMADHVQGYSAQRLFTDMDAWGYSFRLGSSQSWFEHDAEDALAWLGLNQPQLLAHFKRSTAA